MDGIVKSHVSTHQTTMDDQERVEELGKGFNQEKRPSQTSEDISWTFLEERKSAENSPKPPKIVVNR